MCGINQMIVAILSRMFFMQVWNSILGTSKAKLRAFEVAYSIQRYVIKFPENYIMWTETMTLMERF